MSDSYTKVYFINELNGIIKSAVDGLFPYPVWVCGEIQDLKISSKRNIYFNLVEKNARAGQAAAQIQGFIFESMKPRIIQRLRTEDIASVLKKDMEVKLLCKIQFYQNSARVTLTVYDIDPDFMLGQIALNRQKILEELNKEGLIEKNKSRYLEPVPLNIGLITACNTAAYHDFIDELARSGYPFLVKLFDAHMQGQQVEGDILRALEFFSEDKSVDAVAITRGGGSTADLSFFDSEKIARMAASASFPVLSAIGHQINLSVLEMVSYQSFKTPTALAQFFVSRVADYSERVRSAREVLTDTVNVFLDVCGDRLNEKRAELTMTADHICQKEWLRINGMKNALELLDPVNTLKRGFSITKRNGRAVKDIFSLSHGDVLTTSVYNGSITSSVIEVETNGSKE